MRSVRLPALALALECCYWAARCEADSEGTCPAENPDCDAGGAEDEDKHHDPRQCQPWAKACECQLNPKFMLRWCTRSCRLHGGACAAEGPGCGQVSGERACTPAQWSSCPRLCKLNHQKQQAQRESERKKKKQKCVRRETPGGLQETNISAMFERVERSGWAQRYEPKVLSRDPWIMYLGRFLSEQQVDDLLQAVQDSHIKFAPSYELQAGHSQRRKSESCFCSVPACYEDPRVMAAHEAVTNITGLALPNQEYVQILRYRSGDFYVTHQDTSNEYGSSAAGHRIYTLFVYLSSLPPGFGGETNFPALNLNVTPTKGAAVLWSNVQTKNPRYEDRRSFHAALPVRDTAADGTIEKHTKLGANMWLYGFDWRTQHRIGCMNKDAGF